MTRRTTTPVKETAAGGEGPTLDVWIGQYKKNWNSIINPESFSHPAKFARGLLETIVEHALAEGWVKPGDHCLDPFGGIATGAYVCMSKGLRWTGVELEEHFHNLGQGCDCTGISRSDYARLYGRWPRMRYAHGHYLCPRCLAQVGQVTGERRPTQRIVRTHARAGCDEVWAAARTRKPYADVRPGPQPNTVEKTFTFQPLPFPDRQDGVRPPPRPQALFAAETASYARSSGVIPCTQPHHYTGNIEAWAAKGYTGATLLWGDSRRLTEVLAEAGLSIASPPYADGCVHETGQEHTHVRAKARETTGTSKAGWGTNQQGQGIDAYSANVNNLGNMSPGSLDAALAPGAAAPPQMDLLVSSSPYVNGGIHQGGIHHPTDPRRAGQNQAHTFEVTPENLASLPPGSLDAVLEPGAESPPQLDLLVSSSPYAASIHSPNSGPIDFSKVQPHTGGGMPSAHATPGCQGWKPLLYGTTDGQLGALPPGSLDAALASGADLTMSSPPYADGCTHTGGADPQPQHVQGGPLRYVQHGVDATITTPPWLDARSTTTPSIKGYTPTRHDPEAWGTADGQLGAMPPGSVEAVVQGDLVAASPPYEGSEITDHRTTINKTLKGIGPSTRKNAGSFAPVIDAYKTPGTLGNTQGTTFWSAARAIIEQVYLILKPGAHAIWVTKHYIRDGTLVDFPGQWKTLCEHVGFETVHIHLAMLVERRVETHLFEGAVTYEQWKESFFRRLGRKKTGLGIEFETVICQVKSLTASPMPPDEAWEQLPLVEVADACVSSPAYANSVNAQSHGIDWRKAGPATGNRHRGDGSQHEATLRAQLAYGTNPDNLGCMPVDSLDATLSISSPSYGGNEKSDYLLSADGQTRHRDEKRGYRQGHGSFRGSETYGQEVGQLSAMKVGSLDATLSVSSPPYADRCTNDNQRSIHTTGLQSGHNEGDGATYETTSGNLSTFPEGERP